MTMISLQKEISRAMVNSYLIAKGHLGSQEEAVSGPTALLWWKVQVLAQRCVEMRGGRGYVRKLYEFDAAYRDYCAAKVVLCCHNIMITGWTHAHENRPSGRFARRWRASWYGAPWWRACGVLCCRAAIQRPCAFCRGSRASMQRRSGSMWGAGLRLWPGCWTTRESLLDRPFGTIWAVNKASFKAILWYIFQYKDSPWRYE